MYVPNVTGLCYRNLDSVDYGLICGVQKLAEAAGNWELEAHRDYLDVNLHLNFPSWMLDLHALEFLLLLLGLVPLLILLEDLAGLGGFALPRPCFGVLQSRHTFGPCHRAALLDGSI